MSPAKDETRIYMYISNIYMYVCIYIYIYIYIKKKTFIFKRVMFRFLPNLGILGVFEGLEETEI